MTATRGRTAGRLLLPLFLSALLGALPALGATTAQGEAPFVVVTKETPPFVERTADGRFHGFAIDFWEAVAGRLDLETEYRQATLQGIIDAVAQGRADAGVGALSMTADRERILDFTHPWLQAGLAIAVPTARESGWVTVLGRFASLEFLSVLAALALLLLGFGGLLWLVERRANPEHFGGSSSHGVGEGFWWAAVTMTTVGYGDRVPVTRLGRIIALVWMFAALIVLSGFTAAITSSLTVGQLASGVQGVDDLAGVRVVTVSGSSSASWLGRRGQSFRTTDDLATALEEVAGGRADAVVYDEPLLRHRVSARHAAALRVLPGSFDRQAYGFVLTEDDPRREAVNRAILDLLADPAWQGRLAELVP